MSVSINDLDLKRTPFSKRHSRIMILEAPSVKDDDRSQSVLYIAYTFGTRNQEGYRHDLIRFDPVYCGGSLLYTYVANPCALTLNTKRGKIEICMGDDNTLLFRSYDGIGIQFFMTFRNHELFLDRLDGTVCAGFTEIGEFLFEATIGTQTHNNVWNASIMTPGNTHVVWTPDQKGRLAGYLRHSDWSPDRQTGLLSFDDCAANNLADFEKWCEKYELVPERYSDIRLLSIYVIWICNLQPKGLATEEFIFMMRNGRVMRAMGWQQSYQALAARKDLDAAIEMIHSMFNLRDEFGQLPDAVDDHYKHMLPTKPPFQGFALLNLLDNNGEFEALTEDQCMLLYQPMCDWFHWWIEFHDVGDGFISYMHSNESGWDDASIFRKGLPLESPDSYSFLILLAEAVGKLAQRLGRNAEAEKWQGRSEELLDTMLKTFWDGEKFVSRLSATHEIVESDSIAMLQPIILGKRLPQDVIDKISAALHNPNRFFTSRCFVSESLESEFYDTNGPFVLGMILAPVQLMIILGLYNAGEKEFSLECMRRWCETALELEGAEATIRDIDNEKSREILPTEDDEYPVFPRTAIPGKMSSWGSAVFLTLGAILQRESEGI